MTGGRPEPGPPPAVGLAVRPERTGFHARVWPRPPAPWLRFGFAAGGFAASGVALTLVVGESAQVGVAAAGSLAGFGLLGAVVSWLPGFVPVELEVDDDRVYWNGERFTWDRVGGAFGAPGRLQLLDAGGGVLETLKDLQPGVAEWLAAAIVASLPPDRTPVAHGGAGSQSTT